VRGPDRSCILAAVTRAYHIWTIGCQMNRADSRYLASQLESLGYAPTAEAHGADLIILNTCVVRQQAEDKAYDRLAQLKGIKRKRPDTVVALAGCLVGKKGDPSLQDRFPFVDVFMGPSDSQPLIEYLEAANTVTGCRPTVLPPSQDGRAVTAFVPVVLGCSHNCTFCVIPGRRGPEHSRPREDILQEVRQLAASGVREVTLLGQIVDRYGLDLGDGSTLATLLRDVAEIDGIARIRFLTSHPNWMTDSLLDAVRTLYKVCACVEVPVQAGNDDILEKMRRGYTVGEYRRLVEKIRTKVPDVAIHTDIIVGFPGETDEQFMDSYRLMSELEFEMAHIAKYSERPSTVAAARFPDDVPEEEKERRRVLLEELLASTCEKKNRNLIGRRVEVLVEEKGRNGKWHSRTPQNRLVFFEDKRDLRGQVVEVEVEQAKPFALFGRATT
jgi:tRNA-2-methylthio-N6-dimethylallyladenosine synthase